MKVATNLRAHCKLRKKLFQEVFCPQALWQYRSLKHRKKAKKPKTKAAVPDFHWQLWSPETFLCFQSCWTCVFSWPRLPEEEVWTVWWLLMKLMLSWPSYLGLVWLRLWSLRTRTCWRLAVKRYLLFHLRGSFPAAVQYQSSCLRVLTSPVNLKVILKMDKHGNGLEIDQNNLGRCRPLGDVFTEEKFRYMCILAGCDYLASLHGIGLGKASKLLRLAKDPDILKVRTPSRWMLHLGKSLQNPETSALFGEKQNSITLNLTDILSSQTEWTKYISCFSLLASFLTNVRFHLLMAEVDSFGALSPARVSQEKCVLRDRPDWNWWARSHLNVLNSDCCYSIGLIWFYILF